MTETIGSRIAQAFVNSLNLESCPRNKLGKVVVPLANDVVESYKALNVEGEDHLKRSFVRKVFAFIEGSTFAIKNLLIQQSRFKKIVLSEEEMLLLKERTASLNTDGDSIETKLHLKTIPNIKFMFKKANILMEINPPISLDSDGWQSTQRDKSVRDRLTHPKTEEDIRLSGTELEDCKKSFQWFLEQVRIVVHKYDETANSLPPLDYLSAATAR